MTEIEYIAHLWWVTCDHACIWSIHFLLPIYYGIVMLSPNLILVFLESSKLTRHFLWLDIWFKQPVSKYLALMLPNSSLVVAMRRINLGLEPFEHHHMIYLNLLEHFFICTHSWNGHISNKYSWTNVSLRTMFLRFWW